VGISTNYSLLQSGMEAFLIGKASQMTRFLSFFIPNNQIPNATLDAQTVFLGILGWATRFAGNLVSQIARDGIVLAAITLGKASEAFKFKFAENGSSQIDTESNPEQSLRRFNELKSISNNINSAYKMTHRMFLLASIFMLTVFADEYFDPRVGKVVKFVKLVNVIFLTVAFYYANQAAKVVIAADL